MRLPFPQPLSIGTDILQLNRLPKVPHKFRKLVIRVLQPVEQQNFHVSFPNAFDETLHDADFEKRRPREWLGGRWAAKEAAKKAWGASLLGMRDLRVETEPEGNVLVVCTLLEEGEPSQRITEQVAKLSISHDHDYVVATVLASPLDESIIAELRRRKAEAEKSVTPQLSDDDKTAA